MTDTVLIIDFGSQVTQLIARRVRETGVYSEIVPFNAADDALQRLSPKAVILSGGPGERDRDRDTADTGMGLDVGAARARHLLWRAGDG